MIPHNRPWITKKDKESITKIAESRFISQGKKVKELEKNFNKMFRLGYACSLSSGTSALSLSLMALGIKKGMKVAIPTYSCSAILNSVKWAGATPVVCDILKENLLLNPKKIKKNIDAIILVHTFGNYANVNHYKSKKIKIIEDCCHSLGGYQKSKPIGALGDVAIFSFYATKIITSGQGGLVWSKNKKLIDKIVDYREFDLRKNYIPRFNFQMTDLQASLAVNQFKRLKRIREIRRRIAIKYSKYIPKDFKIIIDFKKKNNMIYRFVLMAPNKRRRDKYLKFLNRNGIKAIIPVQKFELLHRYLKMDKKNFPISESICDTTVSLPLYPDLKKKEILKITQVMKRFN